jgi:hypothetical protein
MDALTTDGTTGAKAPISTPRRRAIDERTDATLSVSPSISLITAIHAGIATRIHRTRKLFTA